MKLTVFGLGYLGTVHAACMAQAGFRVLGVDTEARRVEALRAGLPGIHEPGLDDMLRRGLANGRLAFTTSHADAAGFGDVHFLCVGTPQRRDGSAGAELGQLESCLDALAPLFTEDSLVIGKSTVPVGTATRLAERCQPAELAWNPEFLREGHAVADTVAPDRIVAGVRSPRPQAQANQAPRAEKILREVYAVQIDAGVPFVVTDLTTAELVKLTANSFLATKISFINMAARICEEVGADAPLLAEALGYDQRIGSAWLGPGLGFGGGCLPKDIRSFAEQAAELGVPEAVALLHAVDDINTGRRERMVELARSLAGGSLDGAAMAVLGLAFKPGTDDIRDSPAMAVAAELVRAGAAVSAYDPAAMGRAREQCPQIRYADSVLDAAHGADVLLVLTAWPEFGAADPDQVGGAVARKNVADGRHALDPARWTAAGWRYRALGRPDPLVLSALPSPIQRSMRASSSSVSTGLVT